MTDPYTVALPHEASGGDPQPAGPELLAALADGALTEEERAALGAHNAGLLRPPPPSVQLRTAPAPSPRAPGL